MKYIACIALWVAALQACAQFGQGTDVWLINGPRTLEPYQNTLKPDFGFDARRTFLQSQWIGVAGLRAGVEYRRVHRMGLAFYFIDRRIFSRDFGWDLDTDLVEYGFGYNALYYERVLFFNRKWEFAAHAQIGGGNVEVFYNPGGGNDRVRHTRVPFSTGELALYGDYNLLYWLSFGIGFGYRGVTSLGSEINESFSGPVFVANIQVKIFKLVRSLTYDPSAKDEY